MLILNLAVNGDRAKIKCDLIECQEMFHLHWYLYLFCNLGSDANTKKSLYDTLLEIFCFSL